MTMPVRYPLITPILCVIVGLSSFRPGLAAPHHDSEEQEATESIKPEHHDRGRFEHKRLRSHDNHGPHDLKRERSPEEHGKDFPMRGKRSRELLLTTEERQSLIEIIRMIHQEKAEQLEKFAADHGDRVNAILRRFWHPLRPLLELKKHDQEMFELKVNDMRLNREAGELAHQFRQAHQRGDEQESQDLRDQVTDRLDEQFEVRQKIRERELDQLEKRLDGMRTLVEQRQSSRQELIDEQFARLTGQRDANRPEW